MEVKKFNELEDALIVAKWINSARQERGIHTRVLKPEFIDDFKIYLIASPQKIAIYTDLHPEKWTKLMRITFSHYDTLLSLENRLEKTTKFDSINDLFPTITTNDLWPFISLDSMHHSFCWDWDLISSQVICFTSDTNELNKWINEFQAIRVRVGNRARARARV